MPGWIFLNFNVRCAFLASHSFHCPLQNVYRYSAELWLLLSALSQINDLIIFNSSHNKSVCCSSLQTGKGIPSYHSPKSPQSAELAQVWYNVSEIKTKVINLTEKWTDHDVGIKIHSYHYILAILLLIWPFMPIQVQIYHTHVCQRQEEITCLFIFDNKKGWHIGFFQMTCHYHLTVQMQKYVKFMFLLLASTVQN